MARRRQKRGKVPIRGGKRKVLVSPEKKRGRPDKKKRDGDKGGGVAAVASKGSEMKKWKEKAGGKRHLSKRLQTPRKLPESGTPSRKASSEKLLRRTAPPRDY